MQTKVGFDQTYKNFSLELCFFQRFASSASSSSCFQWLAVDIKFSCMCQKIPSLAFVCPSAADPCCSDFKYFPYGVNLVSSTVLLSVTTSYIFFYQFPLAPLLINYLRLYPNKYTVFFFSIKRKRKKKLTRAIRYVGLGFIFNFCTNSSLKNIFLKKE